jgi:hypothetical protein
MYAVLADSQRLLEAFERLPVCFCHHDAFRRNLFASQDSAGSSRTVAVDWAITGFGRIGEEAGITTANNLIWLEVPTDQAKELDQTVFSGYLDGLSAAGWKGDTRLARLGYLSSAVLVTGLACAMLNLDLMGKVDWVALTEHAIGHPVVDVLEAWAAAQLFLLDLADEAFALVDALKQDKALQ